MNSGLCQAEFVNPAGRGENGVSGKNAEFAENTCFPTERVSTFDHIG
jgi:hypothetical protein